MTEKIKKINNPLTVIAVFAALAEINATVSIGLIDKELQSIFIWFVIAFPTLLIVAFFITLNFNTKSLYSPSDYQQDDSFLDILNIQKNRKELSKIDLNVEKVIKDTILSKKTIQELSEIEVEKQKDFLEKLSQTLILKIQNKSFLSLDFSDFIEDDNIFRYPVESFSFFQELLDEIYHKIEKQTGSGYTYGKTWVLVDKQTGYTYRKQGTSLNEKGVKIDLRKLDDVDITNGMELKIVKL